MFGYIRVDRPELKVREDVLYKALYCGQCKAQKTCTGQCSRMSLSYDFVFISLVRMALTHETLPVISMKRCILHPLHRRPVAAPSPSLGYGAYTAALLTYHKIEDDRLDERGKKRLLANLVYPWTKHAHGKAITASADYGTLDMAIKQRLDAIHDVEKACLPTADQPAELFGQVMADILLCGDDLPPIEQKLAATIGRHMGRWVYLIDALDDFEEDRKTGRYNPFVCLYGNRPLGDEHREQIRLALYREMGELERALDLFPSDGHSDIEGLLYNIVSKGMPRVTEDVLAGRFHAKQKQGEKSDDAVTRKSERNKTT